MIRLPTFRSRQTMANFCGSRFVGRGLFSLINQKEHRERRLFLNPAFHKTALVSLMEEFNSSTSIMIHDLKMQTDRDPMKGVDLAQQLAKTTLDVIAKVAFGVDFSQGTLY